MPGLLPRYQRSLDERRDLTGSSRFGRPSNSCGTDIDEMHWKQRNANCQKEPRQLRYRALAHCSMTALLSFISSTTQSIKARNFALTWRLGGYAMYNGI